MIDGCDDLVTVLHERHHTARREHRCGECRRVIKVGEVYMVESFISDGRASTHKTCRHCEVVRNWLTDECGGFVYGMIDEDIAEHAWEGYGVSVKLMAVGMDRQWTRKDGKPWRLPRLPKVSGHTVEPNAKP